MARTAELDTSVKCSIGTRDRLAMLESIDSALQLEVTVRLALLFTVLIAGASIVHAQKAQPAAPPDVAKPPADAQRTASGIASKVLTPGTGKEHPGGTSTVTVHYSGWTTDGKSFDSSVGGQPISFPLDRVIKGWTEGVQLMVVGEKRRFWIPGNLAYDGSTRPGALKGMLVFDIELLGIK
jgi:FKBP-type peptidyl-prolyl cis-trans isomerase